jgi:hypothetical protein
MSNTWRWIIGIVVGLIIIAFLFSAISDRQAYWIARGTVPRPIQVTHADNITMIRFPCGMRAGSLLTAKECGFYVWKK